MLERFRTTVLNNYGKYIEFMTDKEFEHVGDKVDHFLT